MSPDDLHGVFRDLDPPPGGLGALRARLEARREQRASRRRLVLVLGAAQASAAVLLLPAPPAPPALPDDPALLRLGLLTAPEAPVSVPAGEQHNLAVMRVETHTPGVTYYRVAVRGTGR